MRRTTVAATLLLMSLALIPAWAGDDAPRSRAMLRLVVVDETHGVLPHATVTVYGQHGTAAVHGTADETGVVFLPAMSAGRARIVASYPGFAPALETTMLRPGVNAESVTLHLAPIVEKVTVTGR